MSTRWDQTASQAPKTTLGTGNQVRQKAAFTLLEVVLVIAVLMVLIGIAAFSFRGLDQEQVLTRYAVDIQELAGKARRTAISEGSSVVLLVGTNAVSARNQQAVLADCTVEIRRWGTNKWSTPRDYAWRFEPNGICEPIGLRLTRGEASYEMLFHPLTALPQEERLWIP